MIIIFLNNWRGNWWEKYKYWVLRVNVGKTNYDSQSRCERFSNRRAERNDKGCEELKCLQINHIPLYISKIT